MLEPVALLLIGVVLGFLPFVVLVVTSYTKISIVLGLLRNALGIQQIPPTMVLNGIAVILTLYILAPIGRQAAEVVQQPGSASGVERVLKGVEAAKRPFQDFLKRHTQPNHTEFFLRTAGVVWAPDQAKDLKEDDLIVLAPAFLVTELNEAFRIGFLLYLVFITVDLVVASALLAMGLSQVNSGNIAIPFKLLLFVTLDGWTRLLQGLVLSYR